MLSRSRAIGGGDVVGRWPPPPVPARFPPASDQVLLTGSAARPAARLDVEPIAVRLGFLAVLRRLQPTSGDELADRAARRRVV